MITAIADLTSCHPMYVSACGNECVLIPNAEDKEVITIDDEKPAITTESYPEQFPCTSTSTSTWAASAGYM